MHPSQLSLEREIGKHEALQHDKGLDTLLFKIARRIILFLALEIARLVLQVADTLAEILGSLVHEDGRDLLVTDKDVLENLCKPRCSGRLTKFFFVDNLGKFAENITLDSDRVVLLCQVDQLEDRNFAPQCDLVGLSSLIKWYRLVSIL